MFRSYVNFKNKQTNKKSALAGVAQWIECQKPANQRVTDSIPSQGTCLGCRTGPSRGHVRSNYTLMFLFLSFSILPLSLNINK